jgi:Tfp pilus assembly protein PilO
MIASFKNTLLYFILLVVLTVTLVIFFILPSVQDIKANKKVLAVKQSEFISKEEEITALKSAQKNPEELKDKITTINNLWPDDKTVSNFIVDLENLANSEGLTFNNVTVSEAKTSTNSKSKTKKIQTISFSFDTKASFDQDISLINKLEKFSRFNSVDSISFSKDNEGLVTMKISGSIYYGQ